VRCYRDSHKSKPQRELSCGTKPISAYANDVPQQHTKDTHDATCDAIAIVTKANRNAEQSREAQPVKQNTMKHIKLFCHNDERQTDTKKHFINLFHSPSSSASTNKLPPAARDLPLALQLV